MAPYKFFAFGMLSISRLFVSSMSQKTLNTGLLIRYKSNLFENEVLNIYQSLMLSIKPLFSSSKSQQTLNKHYHLAWLHSRINEIDKNPIIYVHQKFQ